MQSTCTWKVSVDCITYQARSLHLDVVWAQPDSNYSVGKIAAQNVSSFQQTRGTVTYFLQVWPVQKVLGLSEPFEIVEASELLHC